MKTQRLAWCLVLVLAVAGCSADDTPDSPSPGPGNGETITGNERLGWDQRASGTSELASFRWAIYVDGARSEMTNTSCAATSGAAGFACSGRLPALSPGTHTLELATFVQGEGNESPRSNPFRVTVTGSAPGDSGVVNWSTGDGGVTGDGVQLHVERILDGLQFPADAAFSPDGRLFIAERAGRIRIVRGNQLQPAPALVLDDIAPGGGLLAIAMAPDFMESRHIFTLSTAGSSRGAVFRLARYREVRGVLAQRAVLLEAPAVVAAAAMRFGPDGLLYVALGGSAADSPSSYAGKVLRLLPDGRAPRDRRAGMPAISSGHTAPRALAWRAGTPPLLWIGDGTPDGVEWITGLRLDDVTTGPSMWGLPPFETTSAMTFYDSDAIPEFRGDLLIASADAQRLLRIKFGADPLTPEFSEPLLDKFADPIRVVVAAPDGAIYFLTDTAVGRLSAQEQ